MFALGKWNISPLAQALGIGSRYSGRNDEDQYSVFLTYSRTSTSDGTSKEKSRTNLYWAVCFCSTIRRWHPESCRFDRFVQPTKIQKKKQNTPSTTYHSPQKCKLNRARHAVCLWSDLAWPGSLACHRTMDASHGMLASTARQKETTKPANEAKHDQISIRFMRQAHTCTCTTVGAAAN